ncbi:hypothetical protein PF011_g10052 [Phytophthora fragariae]|uniref:Uncharacterized protein n=1 Tax=Phytophthora fragariae TaxID=53985 RepID=A0A6A3L299_9STRA|nr:hypothetical protein PF011_g10052 [Phytophthora fragariae]
MVAHSHQHSDSGKKKRAPHGRRARVEGKLLVTSRKRQKRRQLVQTVIVGFTMVVKPMERTVVQYGHQHEKCEPDSSTGEQAGAASPRWPSSATTRRQWRCCEAEDSLDSPSRCPSCCRCPRRGISWCVHEGEYGTGQALTRTVLV